MEKYGICFTAVDLRTSTVVKHWTDPHEYDTRQDAMESAQTAVRVFQTIHKSEIVLYYYIGYQKET